ncbi:MAG: hypothetical protein QJR03_08390 [Sphaerobacter sp.]|nr:hypothetical protein [Sphaerobacter sp.]
MRTRILHLAVALGLATALLAAVIAPVGAEPATAVTGRIYFPWVPNNDGIAGVAGVSGAITVQNLEVFAVDVVVRDAAGTKLAAMTLQPRAAQVWTAAQLQLPLPDPASGRPGGAGVVVEATWHDLAAVADSIDNPCTLGTKSPTRGTTGSFDSVDIGTLTVAQVTRVDWKGFVFPATSYTWHYATGTLVIDWSPRGPEPPAGEKYTITYVYGCPAPRIAGVEKHTVGGALGPRTTSETRMVDGYSAVPAGDLALARTGGATLEDQSRWIVPVVQTNSGWNTELVVTNVASTDATVNATFYPAGEQGVAGRSKLLLGNHWLAPGQSVTLDLRAHAGLPAERVGSVWVDASTDVVVAAFRMKPATAMMLTTLAQPRTDNDELSPTEKFGPLVFRDYNGWNTGINIANLADRDNQVTVTYYTYAGNAVATEAVTIPPRAMEYVYTPASGSVGLGEHQVTAVRIAGSAPLAAAIDAVKYLGGQGQGHALSYLAAAKTDGGHAAEPFTPGDPIAARGRWSYACALALPLAQKGDPETGVGDTSGINLFNPGDAAVTAYVQLVDSSGVPVAPTVGANDAEAPLVLALGPHQGATVYTLAHRELTDGFIGAAVVGVVGPGTLVGVSNNVNYAVGGDGSAAFPLVPANAWYRVSGP